VHRGRPEVRAPCADATSVVGTNRLLEVGQDMSALPGYFRHQLVPLSPGIIYFDAQISDSAFDLGVAEQKLDSPEIARASVD
jgi:hypothetical protein